MNFKIERSSSIKFLGNIWDQYLTEDQHINELCNMPRTLFHVFYSIRRYFAKDNIKTLYYTLIYSKIKNSLAFYELAGNTKPNKIQFLQNEFEILKVQDIVTGHSRNYNICT